MGGGDGGEGGEGNASRVRGLPVDFMITDVESRSVQVCVGVGVDVCVGVGVGVSVGVGGSVGVGL